MTADAFSIVCRGFENLGSAVLVYSMKGVLVYANGPALREMRLTSMDDHLLVRSRLAVFDDRGRRLEQCDWPLFRAIRGERISDRALTFTMSEGLAGADAWRGCVDAVQTTFDGLLAEPVVLVTVRDVESFAGVGGPGGVDAVVGTGEPAHLTTILDSLHVAVVIADRAGRFVRVNWAYDHLLGTDEVPGGLEGYDVFEGYDPASGLRLSPAEWPLATALTHGSTTVRRRIDVRRRDNAELRNMSLSAAPLRGANDEIVGGIVIVEDLTELLRAENGIRVSEERFRVMIDGARDHAFCMLDEGGRIGTWSTGGERLKQYTKDEVVGRHYAILFSPGDVAAGVPEKLLAQAASDGIADFRGWRCRRDGSRFWADTVLSAVHERGMLIGFAEVTRDMTALRLSQEQLRLRDEALRAVSQGILVADVRTSDQPIVLVSGGFKQLTGYSPEEVIGRNCRFLQGPGTDPEAVDLIRQAIKAGREQSVEILNTRKDGSTFWNALYLSPIIEEDGSIEKYVGVMADVTQRRELEDRLRQSQKMDALGRMAGGIAHDFNNILTVINGNAEDLLDQTSAGSPMREQLNLIMCAGIRADLLTNQLLAFGRQSELTRTELSLALIVEEMQRLLVSLVGPTIKLVVTADAELWAIDADRSQVEQVILNVVMNARDAMPHGGTIAIVMSNDSASDESSLGTVRLQVIDDGCGMDSHTRDQAFEPFFSTKGSDGSGLGLATVFGVIAQLRGSVSLRSTPGEGTTVDIGLPRGENASIVEVSAVAEVRPASPLRTALVAEDEPGVRRLIRRHLEHRGMVVLEAGNGLEAMSLALRQPGSVDLLVTDIVMPTMNGVALAEALRLKQPDLRVLFITGYADEKLVEQLQEEILVRKPFSMKEFNKALLAVSDI